MGSHLPKFECSFSVTHRNSDQHARVGHLKTAHGELETPCFLPIASNGTLRAISFEEAIECGTRIIMANAWHIYREAGPEKLRELGGVHHLMKWPGPLVTDSGGYQVFSLRDTSKITEDGVAFESAVDSLTPESVVEMQKCLGSDVMFVLDDCAPYPCSKQRALEAVERTTSWAKRCMSAHKSLPRQYDHPQVLWGIIQGGAFKSLRKQSAEEVSRLGFDGYGIGGLSIGMSRSLIREMTVLTCESLPQDKPRHLLGVGLPWQVLDGVEDGVDSFDCVLPIRKAQRGLAYTAFGEVLYKHAPQPKDADLPLDPECDCSTCKKYTRQQLRDIYIKEKPVAGHLAVIHNIWYYHKLLERTRAAIREDRFLDFKEEAMLKWFPATDGIPGKMK